MKRNIQNAIDRIMITLHLPRTKMELFEPARIDDMQNVDYIHWRSWFEDYWWGGRFPKDRNTEINIIREYTWARLKHERPDRQFIDYAIWLYEKYPGLTLTEAVMKNRDTLWKKIKRFFGAR